MKPLLLPPNPVQRFYLGGARIARFRGRDGWADRAPEDWVGSTTAVAGEAERGRSRLPGGEFLADAIAREPEAYLGAKHTDRFGPDPGFLVKLLDAGERLPVHVHPDRAFAAAGLRSRYGKTEAWIVVEADPGAAVRLGWVEDVDAGRLECWVAEQDVPGMLAGMHRIPARPGDTVLVPGGTPHVIGEGIMVVELQEPTDLSVLLEWRGFCEDPAGIGDLGLGFPAALGAVDRSGLSEERLAELTSGRSGTSPRHELFPAEAGAFFAAEWLSGGAELPPSFAVLVVLHGEGRLRAASGDLEVRRGDTVLVPFACGETLLEGGAEAIRCLPPTRSPEPQAA